MFPSSLVPPSQAPVSPCNFRPRYSGDNIQPPFFLPCLSFLPSHHLSLSPWLHLSLHLFHFVAYGLRWIKDLRPSTAAHTGHGCTENFGVARGSFRRWAIKDGVSKTSKMAGLTRRRNGLLRPLVTLDLGSHKFASNPSSYWYPWFATKVAESQNTLFETNCQNFDS